MSMWAVFIWESSLLCSVVLSPSARSITVPAGFVQKLNDHLLLVYTGKTRLARNLLQVSPGPRREGREMAQLS